MAKKNILTRSRLKKAEALLNQNNLPAAAKLYEEICRLGGASGEIWARLSILKRQTGDLPAAESCGRKAVGLSPALAIAHHALGAALHAQGQLEDAITCYRTATGLQSELVEAHYYLANALREKGDLDEAIAAYTLLLRIAPDHFEGLNNFGALLTNMERSQEAAKILSRALEINASSVEALTNLARAHTLIGLPNTAISLLQKAIKLRPNFLDAYLELAWALRLGGQNEAAIRCFDEALQLAPGNRRALIGKAKIHEILGRPDEAWHILEPLLQGEGISDALPVYFDISQDIGRRDHAVAFLDATLKRKDINQAATAPLHFRLGKHLDQQKAYDRAFDHYSRANALTLRQFDINEARTQFDAIRSVYTPVFVREMPCSANASRLPVFIIGMPRSGTSLVEQIIASHPDIYGAGETDNIMQLSTALSKRYATGVFPDFIPKLSQSALDSAARELEKTMTALSPTAKRITDKMPHNFIYVGLMLQLFPDCKIIHCRRNPLDTCLSCYVSEFGSNFHNYAYDLETLGQYYGLYAELMAYWIKLFPGRILQVDYEELVADQEQVSRSMLEHIDMEWSDQCLDFHKLGRVINTISYNQVRQPMYSRSIERWRNYATHLEPLRNALERSGVKYRA